MGEVLLLLEWCLLVLDLLILLVLLVHIFFIFFLKLLQQMIQHNLAVLNRSALFGHLRILERRMLGPSMWRSRPAYFSTRLGNIRFEGTLLVLELLFFILLVVYFTHLVLLPVLVLLVESVCSVLVYFSLRTGTAPHVLGLLLLLLGLG